MYVVLCGSQDLESTDWVWIDCNEIVKKSRFKHLIRRLGSHLFVFCSVVRHSFETLIVFEKMVDVNVGKKKPQKSLKTKAIHF